MNWPTPAEVEAAERETLREWLNQLPAVTQDGQSDILRRITARMQELSPYERPKFIPMPAAAPTAPKKAKAAKAPAKDEPPPLSTTDFFASLRAR